MDLNGSTVSQIQRRWNKYQAYALREKKAYLKKLSFSQGLRIFSDLHSFTRISSCEQPPMFHINKRNTLIRIHRMFSRIKL